MSHYKFTLTIYHSVWLMSAPAMSLNGQFALSDHMIASPSTVTKDVVVRASLQSRTLTAFNLKVLLQNHNHHVLWGIGVFLTLTLTLTLKYSCTQI